MSFDQKKKNDIELDDLNIKMHLNTSFEEEGISVSEDLINRTLEAIKKQTTEASEEKEHIQVIEPKISSWSKYVRGFASVAAAALILVVGFNAVRLMGNSKSENFTTSDKSKYDKSTDMAKMEAASDTTADTAGTKDTGEEAMPFSAQAEDESQVAGQSNEIYTNKSDGNIADRKEINGTVDDKTAYTKEDTGKPLMTANAEDKENPVDEDIETVTFSEISQISYEEAETVEVVDSTTNSIVMKSDREEIKQLYAVLEQHSFLKNTEIPETSRFVLTIKTKEKSCKISVSDNNITVNLQLGKDAMEYSYIAADQKLLLSDLESLFLDTKQ